MAHDYRDVLLKAASYVEQGWCQSNWYWANEGIPCGIPSCTNHRENDIQPEQVASGLRPDKVCLEGAIRLAAYELTGDRLSLDYDAEIPLVAQADAKVARLLGTDQDRIWEWNDAEGRTSDEVAAALREAADADDAG